MNDGDDRSPKRRRADDHPYGKAVGRKNTPEQEITKFDSGVIQIIKVNNKDVKIFKLTDGKVVICKAGRYVHQVKGADGVMKNVPCDAWGKPQPVKVPAASSPPKAVKEEKAVPVKQEVKVKKEKGVGEVKVKREQPAVKRERPETARPAQKEEEPEADLDDDDNVLLSQILEEVAKKVDLSDAKALEEQREKKKAEEARKPPKRPKVAKFPPNFDALQKKIQKMKDQITQHDAKLQGKEDTKEVSLSTSKTNYIDPRVVSAWCQRQNVRWTQCYNRSLLEKFPWALKCDPNFIFGANPPPPIGDDDDADDGDDGSGSGSPGSGDEED